jgi:hypothetical protein
MITKTNNKKVDSTLHALLSLDGDTVSRKNKAYSTRITVKALESAQLQVCKA